MKSRKILFVLLVLGMIFALSGCSSEESNDLKHYVNVDLVILNKNESEAINGFNELAKSFEETPEFYTKLYKTLDKTTIPKYEEFLKKLKEIEPKTEAVQKLHTLHVAGAEKQLEALKTYHTGISEKNEYKIAAANTMLAEAKILMDAYRQAAIELAEKLNIDWR